MEIFLLCVLSTDLAYSSFGVMPTHSSKHTPSPLHLTSLITRHCPLLLLESLQLDHLDRSHRIN